MKQNKPIEKGLLKKATAYAVANKLLASFATIPAGLYLAFSIINNSTPHIIASSITSASILAGAIFTAHMEEKTDEQYRELIKNQPKKVYTANDFELDDDDFSELE